MSGTFLCLNVSTQLLPSRHTHHTVNLLPYKTALVLLIYATDLMACMYSLLAVYHRIGHKLEHQAG